MMCSIRNTCVAARGALVAVVLGGVALGLGGCASSPAPLPPDAAVRSLELFLSRASLFGTEFEQYSLADDKLFYECGSIERGRFIGRHQGVVALEPERLAAVTTAAYAVERTVTAGSPTLAEPGTNRSMFDPGQYTLTARLSDGEAALNVRTSLDAVVNKGSAQNERLERLAALIRGGATGACAQPTFFGLTRAN